MHSQMPVHPEKNRLRELAEKWLKGEITPEEKAFIEQWYNNEPGKPVFWETPESEAEVRDRIFSRLQASIAASKPDEETPVIRINQFRRNIRRIAAIAAIFAVAILGIRFLFQREKQIITSAEQVSLVAPDARVLDQTTNYTRHLTLPDGSTVVLKANSKLDYSGNFSGKSREVILVGEAYFDISHDEKRPFIIHTGEVKTTVLGTAFNINANPQSRRIVIAVTRGKVKVEKQDKVLAILHPNQQVICNPNAAEGELKEVNAEALVTDWTRQDMVFDGQSFLQIVDLLNRRYGVDIRLNNAALEHCTIKAFFNGTESLDKVLDVLCIISNSRYSHPDEKQYIIDGEGCGS
jgi:transmembrane sensor